MHEIQFRLPHIKLAGLTNGNTDGIKVLALHGWLDNAASFTPLARYLSEMELIAVDLPGHGRSDHRSVDAHYHLLDYVHDVHTLIESQKWDQVVILGHSMGAILGALYTACFPDKVTKFVSIEAFGPIVGSAESSPEQLREAIFSRMALPRSVKQHPAKFDQVVAARAKVGKLGFESATLLVERNVRGGTGQLEWRSDRRLRTRSSLRLTHEQAEAFMRNIRCPMLAVLGDAGFENLRETIALRRHWVDQLTIVTCRGGHHLHMDNPLDVAKQIIYFLEQ